MKAFSIVFIILGMALNFYYSAVLGIVGVFIGIWMLVTLSSNQKSVAAGIFGLLFTGLLGGIFYLLWQPEEF